MKFIVVFACAVAAASAGWVSPIAPLATVVAGPQHLPVIGPNGVPVDTVEVQHARAAHLAQKVEAHARNGDWAVAHSAPIIGLNHAAPLALAHSGIPAPIWANQGASIIAAGSPAAWPTTLGVPAVTADGIPLETPEVVAAKSNHFAAHGEALARNSPIISEIPIVAHAAPIALAAPLLSHGLVGHVGIPETVEVVAAKQAHFAAHAEALSRNGHIVHGAHNIWRRSIIASAPLAIATPIIAGPQHLPIIGANGVPVDTAEVQHARAAHLAHKVEAHARNGDWAIAHSAPIVGLGHAAPLALAHQGIAAPVWAHQGASIIAGSPAAWPTTLGVPAVTADGIPLETPEVVAAKSNHFAAHGEALARNSPIISEVPIIAAAPVAAPWW